MNKVSRAADAVLLAAGFFCLAVLLLNLTRHGWAWHYILLVVAAVLFAALSLSVSTKRNVVLLLLSTAVGLYGAELLLGNALLSSTRFSLVDWLTLPACKKSCNSQCVGPEKYVFG